MVLGYPSCCSMLHEFSSWLPAFLSILHVTVILSQWEISCCGFGTYFVRGCLTFTSRFNCQQYKQQSKILYNPACSYVIKKNRNKKLYMTTVNLLHLFEWLSALYCALQLYDVITFIPACTWKQHRNLRHSQL